MTSSADASTKEFALLSGPIFPSLTKFALPILFALFLQSLYGAVDLLIVGKFAETADVSGVATGSMVMMTVTMVITGLAMGVTVLIGQEIGRRDPWKAGEATGTGIALFAIIGVLMTVLMTGFANGWASFMKAPEEAFSETASYIRICGAGSLFIIAYNIIGSIFRGIGDSKTPLLTVLIAAALNIAGDLICVAGLGLGAAGAAVATVVAQAVSVLLSLLIIRRKNVPITFRRGMIRLKGEIVRKELKLGAPIALQEILVGFSFMFIQMMVNDMGVVASAGVGVGEKICGFIMLIPSAYSQAMSAFTAQNMGAGQPERAKKGFRIAVLTSMAINVVVFWMSFFHGDLLGALFSKDPAVVAACQSYLKAYAIDCMLTPLLFCSFGYFNGCERTVFVMINGLVGAFCVRVPVVWLVTRFLEAPTLFQVGLATPCSTVVQDAMCIIMFLVLAKKEREAHVGKEIR